MDVEQRFGTSKFPPVAVHLLGFRQSLSRPKDKKVIKSLSFSWIVRRVYYSLTVWRFKPILSAGLRFHPHLSGGLRLRNYRAVARNHKFSSRFSVLACFCGGYPNRVKRLTRLRGSIVSRPSDLIAWKWLDTCPFSSQATTSWVKNSEREGSIARPWTRK